MPPRKTEAGAVGLRLTMPGAPCTPHSVPGVPGFFWPDRPTPVGGPGDPVSLERAEELAADPSVHLEIVPVDDVDRCRADYAQWLDVSRGVLRQLAQTAVGDEVFIAEDQVAAAHHAPAPHTTTED